MNVYDALAAPAPTREPMAMAAPRPAAARSLFLVSGISFICVVCRSVRLTLASQLNSQRHEGDPGHVPVTRVLPATSQVRASAAGGDEPGWFHWCTATTGSSG